MGEARCKTFLTMEFMDNTKSTLISSGNASPQGAINRKARKGSLISIIGAADIDNTIIDLCPEIIDISIAKRIIISDMIRDYIFGNRLTAFIIAQQTNEITAEFIGGIRIIVKENDISNISELQDCIIDFANGIDTSDLCIVGS